MMQHKCYVNPQATQGRFVTLYIKCKIKSEENTLIAQ